MAQKNILILLTYLVVHICRAQLQHLPIKCNIKMKKLSHCNHLNSFSKFTLSLYLIDGDDGKKEEAKGKGKK